MVGAVVTGLTGGAGARGLSVSVPISAGELVDKVSVLRIKRARLADPAKRDRVEEELEVLERILHHAVRRTELSEWLKDLAAVNGAIWDAEERLRDHERRQEFDAAFVDVARSVYRLNDRRARIKQTVDTTLRSEIREQKSYL